MAERIENEIDLIEKLDISMFLTIWVYLQRAVTKKRKKKKQVLLLNKEKSEKGDEDSAFEW